MSKRHIKLTIIVAGLFSTIMCALKIGKRILLPHPALIAEVMTISFQPYSIAYYAADTIHFTAPYGKLKPYLTDRGKWCIGLNEIGI